MAFRANFLKRLPPLFLFLLAACSWSEPRVIELPKGIGPTSDAFVSALQKGDRAAAEKIVAPAARDELQAQFSKEHNLLKSSPALTPRFITFKPAAQTGPEDLRLPSSMRQRPATNGRLPKCGCSGWL